MSILCKCLNTNAFFNVDFSGFSLVFVLRLSISCPLRFAAIVEYVPKPRKRLSLFKIMRVDVVGVCFALERIVSICCAPVSILRQHDKEEQAIKQKLGQEQAFNLLPKMDRFVLP